MDEMGKNLGVLSRRVVQESNGNGVSSGRVVIPEKRFRWGTREVLPGAVLMSFGSLFAYAARDAIWQGKPVRVMSVIVREGGGVSSSAVVQAPGWIEAAPLAVAVSALADGVVKEVLVLEGEPVEAGQVVARLVVDDARLALDRARADVAQREAELRAVKAGLHAAEQDWEHPIERQRSVETSEAMVAMNRAELARLPAEVAAQAALVEELRAEYVRVAEVFANQSAANIELIRAKQQHEAQEANLTATRGREPMIQARIRQLEAEWQAAKEGLRLRIQEHRVLEESRAGVVRAGAELARAKTMLEEAELRLARMDVRAPVSGIVLTRLVEPGTTTERVFAPGNLLKMEGQQATAWIADLENHTAIARRVSLGGTKVDGWVEVVEGLHPGDRLIVADPGSVRDGERIRIVGEAGAGGGFTGGHDDGAH